MAKRVVVLLRTEEAAALERLAADDRRSLDMEILALALQGAIALGYLERAGGYQSGAPTIMGGELIVRRRTDDERTAAEALDQVDDVYRRTEEFLAIVERELAEGSAKAHELRGTLDRRRVPSGVR